MLDELIEYYTPMMRKNQKERMQRKKAAGLESFQTYKENEQPRTEEEKKMVEQLMALLYAMEHMPANELEQLQRQCKLDLKH